ncbi:MAG: hypothetical protein UR96_C0029G0004 [candidate division WS6 bacterium GW2011_GWC1_36_11]|uniref:Uncharacterized protein n=2 Tax=Candidatus Dojkabacteria TaxID=74243 RepID=A0A0G0FWB8_9BACT|nr:MAG: hypothetical protein UR96_C0029G0004 [candidate division WS6 bacterium GW2011_GWC1_36_11]
MAGDGKDLKYPEEETKILRYLNELKEWFANKNIHELKMTEYNVEKLEIALRELGFISSERCIDLTRDTLYFQVNIDREPGLYLNMWADNPECKGDLLLSNIGFLENGETGDLYILGHGGDWPPQLLRDDVNNIPGSDKAIALACCMVEIAEAQLVAA